MAPSICRPSTLNLSLASKHNVGQEGLVLLIYGFFLIYRGCTATFNHFFAEGQLKQQQGCQPTSPLVPSRPSAPPLLCGGLHSVVTRVPRGEFSPPEAKPFSFQLRSRKAPERAGEGPAALPCLHSTRQLRCRHRVWTHPKSAHAMPSSPPPCPQLLHPVNGGGNPPPPMEAPSSCWM